MAGYLIHGLSAFFSTNTHVDWQGTTNASMQELERITELQRVLATGLSSKALPFAAAQARPQSSFPALA